MLRQTTCRILGGSRRCLDRVRLVGNGSPRPTCRRPRRTQLLAPRRKLAAATDGVAMTRSVGNASMPIPELPMAPMPIGGNERQRSSVISPIGMPSVATPVENANDSPAKKWPVHEIGGTGKARVLFTFASRANFQSSRELNSAQSHVRCAIFASFSHDISVRASSDARIDTYALRIGARQRTRLYRLHRR